MFGGQVYRTSAHLPGTGRRPPSRPLSATDLRERVVRELVETEMAYVRDLQTTAVFVQHAACFPFIDQGQCTALARRLHALEMLHKGILAKWEPLLHDDAAVTGHSVRDIARGMAPLLNGHAAYTDYCLAYLEV